MKAVITGAYSYIGAAVANELHSRGWEITTLTRRKGDAHHAVLPLRFDEAYLVDAMKGADLFINTYWVRLPIKGESFERAVERSKLLLSCAKEAGIKRIVHLSVSNAEKGRNLGYYNGKYLVEQYLKGLDVSYGIVRPTLVVGPNDVLTNNIAWFIKRFPVFFVPGNGSYKLQPITLTDTGRIVADVAERPDDIEVDAAGPEVFSFRQYVEAIKKVCRSKVDIVSVPDPLALLALKLVGKYMGDHILAKEELLGLKQQLLLSDRTVLGRESVSRWISLNRFKLGHQYVNDVKRHFTDGVQSNILYPWTIT